MDTSGEGGFDTVRVHVLSSLAHWASYSIQGTGSAAAENGL